MLLSVCGEKRSPSPEKKLSHVVEASIQPAQNNQVVPVRFIYHGGRQYLLLSLASSPAAAPFHLFISFFFSKYAKSPPRCIRSAEKMNTTERCEGVKILPAVFSNRSDSAGVIVGAPTGLLADWKSEEEMEERCAATKRASPPRRSLG